MIDERKRMVERQLIPRGIHDQNVLDAFLTVKRELFVPRAYQAYAYHDGPLEIGEDQTISQPFIVALMTQALNIKPEDTVLEIGTGSGYQTAVLSGLCKHIYTIERIKNLQDRAKDTLMKEGYTNITYLIGDGSKGNLEHAPYDKIIVTAAARKLPKTLLDQLNDPGIMVVPVGGWFMQSLMKIEKKDGAIKKDTLCGCRFVPLIEE